MLKCVAVLVLICQLLTASALSASILSLDLDTDANVHIHSVYLCGLSAPVSLNSQPVSYTILSFNVDEVNGNTTYAFYNDQSQFMAAFGPAGMSLVSMIKNTQDRAVAPMPLFSPLSQDQFFLPDSLSTAGMFNRYTSYVYWILPSGTVEAVALVFILSQRPLFPNRQMALTFPTQGVNYISGSMLPIVTATLGVRFFVLQKIPKQRYTLASYASAFGTAPGIVYQLLESDRNYPTEWIEEMISDTHLIKANTTIGTTFTFDYVTLQAYNRKAVAGAVLPPQNMITAYPVPGVGALDFQATQDFLLQATDSISSVSTNSERNFMMAGWVGGWALMQALNMYTGTKYMAKEVFHDNLANAQSMFLVSDLFYGSMGAPCSAIAKAQGGICECRWAGNSVWFSKLARTGSSYDSEPLRGVMFQYAMNTCANVALYGEVNRAKFALPQTIHVVGVSPRDNEMMSSICGQTNDAIETVSNATLYWHHSRHAYTGYCIPSSMDSVSSDLSRHNNTYVTTSLMGVVPDAVATSDSLTRTLILDFMAQTTQPRVARANFVYLFPTLEQELYVLAAYLSNVVMDVSVVCAVVRNSRYSSSILSLVMTTLKTFDIVPFSSNVVIATGDLASGIPSSCTHTFVIGTADGDAAALEAYLKAEANALVLMSFDDVTKFYASLGSAFKSSSSTVTNRLVFATNLPSWTGSSMSSNALNAASALSRVGEYVGTLAPAVQTPAAVRAFIVAMVYDRLTMGSNWGLPDIEGALYNQETLFVGGMTFGPFRKSWSGTQGVINYGARDISVWSFTRAVNRSAAVLMPPMNPSLVYVPSATSSNVRPNISLKHENCVSMQESSSYMTPASSTTIDLKIGATRITTAPTTAVAGSDSTSIPSDDTTLRDVLGALVTALVLIGVYIIVLLLFHFRVPQCAWVYVQSVPLCWRWRDRYARGPGYVRAANKIRDAVVKQNSEDCVLGFKLQTMCPTADTEPSQLTTICIHVEQWRPLWVRHPRATSHAVRHFQRCLRRTAVKHKVYVMRSVEGMVVLLSPSADVGLSFARELVDEVAKDNTKDSGAVTEEYGHFGCGQIGVRGLRMRVAVHSGPATRRADACGRALFTGPSIDGAVGAACAAGTAGLVVVTASAIKSMGTKADKWRLKSMGNNPLVQAFVDDALYSLTVIQSEAACPHGTRSVADVCNALHLLTVSCEQTKEGMVPWCMRLLVAHYTNMSENERVSDLRFLAGLFILTPALSAEHDSTRAEYMFLLRCVSEHMASVMECRHGYSRSVIQRPQTREGVGSTSVTFIEEENRELFGLTEHNHRPTALGRRSCTFRRQTLRVFAYDIDEDAA